MKEAPSPRMLKWTAISLGMMLLGMLMIFVLLLIKKINDNNKICDYPEAFILQHQGNIVSVSDGGNYFLVTLKNDLKDTYTLVSLEKCSGKELSRYQLRQLK